MGIGTLPGTETLITRELLLEQIGEHMPEINLPYTVQAKLIFLIEQLGLDTPEETSSLNAKVDQLIKYTAPPTICAASSVTLGTTQQIIITAEEEGIIRKSFSIFNESPNTVYIDYVTGVSSTVKKLQLPPLYFWEPEVIYQGNIFAVAGAENTNIEIRIER